ncbi:hypothetical protein NHX12_023214 [Muraenolepis orangiensis]|uniref:Uncharacterized protein n=1 Tax=Muraenolepis orangiensis TaxID=630683 RepID=A0A9Q0ISJ4_9TELE|nr:hypothetical protein NHX12_023214 [Muraenolepis orangiensis]
MNPQQREREQPMVSGRGGRRRRAGPPAVLRFAPQTRGSRSTRCVQSRLSRSVSSFVVGFGVVAGVPVAVAVVTVAAAVALGVARPTACRAVPHRGFRVHLEVVFRSLTVAV